jgi:hypothetical protein
MEIPQKNPKLGLVNQLYKEIQNFENEFGRSAAIGKGIANLLLDLMESNPDEPEEKEMKPQPPKNKDNYHAMSKSLKNIENLAKQLGLVLVTDMGKVDQVYGIENFNSTMVNLSFEVGNIKVLQETLQTLVEDIETGTEVEKQEAINNLAELMGMIKRNILSKTSGKAVNESKSAQALAEIYYIIGKHNHFSKTNGPFFEEVFQDLNESQQESAFDLFLKFQKNVASYIGIIATGDANIDYLEEGNKKLTSWLEESAKLSYIPAIAIYQEQIKAAFAESCQSFLEAHEKWAKNGNPAQNFEDAIKFATNVVNKYRNNRN